MPHFFFFGACAVFWLVLTVKILYFTVTSITFAGCFKAFNRMVTIVPWFVREIIQANNFISVLLTGFCSSLVGVGQDFLKCTKPFELQSISSWNFQVNLFHCIYLSTNWYWIAVIATKKKKNAIQELMISPKIYKIRLIWTLQMVWIPQRPAVDLFKIKSQFTENVKLLWTCFFFLILSTRETNNFIGHFFVSLCNYLWLSMCKCSMIFRWNGVWLDWKSNWDTNCFLSNIQTH